MSSIMELPFFTCSRRIFANGCSSVPRYFVYIFSIIDMFADISSEIVATPSRPSLPWVENFHHQCRNRRLDSCGYWIVSWMDYLLKRAVCHFCYRNKTKLDGCLDYLSRQQCQVACLAYSLEISSLRLQACQASQA